MSVELLQRLVSFYKWPIPSDATSGITNFASKAAGAFFERTAECVGDEVVCKSCGVSVGKWGNKSPAAVHRTISRKCPALNPSPSDLDSGSTSVTSNSRDLQPRSFESLVHLHQNPYLQYLPTHIQSQVIDAAQQTQEVRTPNRAPASECDFPADCTPDQSPSHNHCQNASRARRMLFADPDTEQNLQDRTGRMSTTSTTTVPGNTTTSRPCANLPSVLQQTPVTHPFQTKCGGYDSLFASQRLQTFPGPTNCVKYQSWAEEGFVYRVVQQDLMCVFCGTVVVLNGHQPKVAHKKACPTCPFVMGFDLGNISLQHEKDIRLQYYQQQAAKKELEFDLVIKYPGYEREDDRQGSFKNWPKMCEKMFPSSVMVSAGFYYCGCSDKVVCYSCGVELYDWSEEADVWTTHARVAPTCLHVIHHRGQDFVNQAASTQVLVEVKNTATAAGGIVGVTGKKAGLLNLDVDAVAAALACGYTLPQIQHAIVKFFCETSRYPNEAILKASLKATDENHITICKQQHALHQNHTVIQQKDTALQEQATVIHQKDTALQEQGTALYQKDTQLQMTAAQLAEMGGTIAEKEETIEEMGEQLNSYHDQLSCQDHQLKLQDEQIRSLMQQVQRLRADQQVNRQHPPPHDDGGDDPNMMCKICMSDKPRMIFLPCGHLFSCAECTSRLPDKRCPVCRQDISNVLPAFVA